jgi:hypothetical protein
MKILSSSEMYKKKQLFSPLITDAYSLSQYTVYHLLARVLAKRIHEVLTHDPAGHENQILTCIFKSIIKSYHYCFLYKKGVEKKEKG